MPKALHGMQKLKPQHVIAILARLFAIWLFVSIFRNTFGLIVLFDQLDQTAAISIAVTVIGLPLILAIVLWVFPLTVASKLVSPSIEETSNDLISESSLYSLGFILLGAYFLVTGLTDGSSWLVSFFQYGKESSDPWLEMFKPSWLPGLVSSALEIVLGAFLLIGSRAISKFILWARYAE